ncbi:MAG: hypothetical protein ACK5T6_02885, partial [Pirellula sp.]
TIVASGYLEINSRMISIRSSLKCEGQYIRELFENGIEDFYVLAADDHYTKNNGSLHERSFSFVLCT